MILTVSVAFLAFADQTVPPEVTVYNQGFGFIKEVRTLHLNSGVQRVAIENVPEQIDPTSVGVKSLDGPNSFSLLEQNYQYDLISPAAIINKSVGQKVRLIRDLGDRKDVLTGTLLNVPISIVADPNGGSSEFYEGMVIKADDGRIVLDPQGEVEVETVPPDLIARPTLFWDLDSSTAGVKRCELSYITQGMQWTANYVLNLSNLSRADLHGWVTIDNQSGGEFKDAKLKLLAGEVHRAVDSIDFVDYDPRDTSLAINTPAPPAFKEQSLFEYHIYTLQRPSTLKNKETKQISLMEGHEVPYTKKIIVDSTSEYGYYRPAEGEVGTGPVQAMVHILFTNDKQSHLGMPLPQGRIRIYSRDSDGSAQFLGEDYISHTPRNETINLLVGKSFDIAGSRKRLSFKKIDSTHTRERFDIEIRNRKQTSQKVYLLERHWDDWKVSGAGDPFTKEDSNTIQFVLNLKPNEVRKVTYNLDTHW